MCYFLLTFITLAISIGFADELIDDFGTGGAKNKRNYDWYYFSDVKDGGNSNILNAEELPNGSYSNFKPVKEGSDSGYCAKLEYVLGDILPTVNSDYDITEHCNFVAIGTDIARPGGITDIGPAYGISFRARSLDSIVVFFELVTSNIYDYGYYRAYFWITDTWQTFKVDFNNPDQFMIPQNVSYDINTHPLMLSKVQKINWQVAKCFTGIDLYPYLKLDAPYYDYQSPSDSGCLYLDDIILLDSTTVAVNYIPILHPKRTCPIVVPGDLLGRRVSVSGFTKIASGMYVKPDLNNSNINSCIHLTNP